MGDVVGAKFGSAPTVDAVLADCIGQGHEAIIVVARDKDGYIFTAWSDGTFTTEKIGLLEMAKEALIRSMDSEDG